MTGLDVDLKLQLKNQPVEHIVEFYSSDFVVVVKSSEVWHENRNIKCSQGQLANTHICALKQKKKEEGNFQSYITCCRQVILGCIRYSGPTCKASDE